jgi:hypothetical protein
MNMRGRKKECRCAKGALKIMYNIGAKSKREAKLYTLLSTLHDMITRICALPVSRVSQHIGTTEVRTYMFDTDGYIHVRSSRIEGLQVPS